MKQTLFLRQLEMYFDTHLPDVKHCSPNTIESYADAFKLLFQFFEEQKKMPHYKIDYKNFTAMLIEDFTLWLTRERSCSAASVRQRLSAINSFMKYASRREMAALSAFTAVSGAEKPMAAKPAFPYFSLEEIQVLLHLPDPNRKIEKRDLVLLSLLYDSAARAQELCDLTVDSIKFGQITKVKLIGKGCKAREIPISQEVANLLRYHIKETGLEGRRGESLFTSQLGGKMTTACVRNLVQKYVMKGKIAYPDLFHEAKYSPHSFRHSKSVHMVESGTQLIYIRNFLGHASVQSTEIYARIGQEKIIKMLMERGKSSAPSCSVEKSKNEPYPKFLNEARHQ